MDYVDFKWTSMGLHVYYIESTGSPLILVRDSKVQRRSMSVCHISICLSRWKGVRRLLHARCGMMGTLSSVEGRY